ncbi:5-hydroxytryptamine receptor 1F-like [Carassius carassius]|uniref:5-hydroxytryptamine receptor 1F-like n=1 Tax=Carassius carassius TaxID=217509 RepID=UPI002868AFC0|nr:5-hydroxytryptamine receptor 1F-like [Carassius carassius]
MVITAILITRKLHQPANYLICSLAVTDLLVAVLVMPVSIVYIAEETWVLGPIVCQLCLGVDVTCCTCSILHLAAIALDRYRAITDAVAYSQKHTYKRTIITILALWTLSVLVSLPPLVWRKFPVEHKDGEREVMDCLIELDDVAFTVYSTFGAFYIPLTLILVLYYKIYKAAEMLRNRRGCSRLVKQRITGARERWAALTLGLILGAFVVCRLPFFLKEVIVNICPNCSTSAVLADFLTWLWYLNSIIKLLIYTIFNEDFKKAFKRLLPLCCSNIL